MIVNSNFFINVARLLSGGLLVTYLGGAFAAGDDDTAPPPPTPTSQCTDGQIYDKKTKKCRPASHTGFNDKDRYLALRELAYAGRYRSAEMVLQATSDNSSSEVLAYVGFLHRKQGRYAEAVNSYLLALEKNPDNILVRSYLGQGFVEQKRLDLAELQLDEIRRRNGVGTWAEKSLSLAMKTGVTSSY
jgi:tetratricopeptide (TPR) repeat protein